MAYEKQKQALIEGMKKYINHGEKFVEAVKEVMPLSDFIEQNIDELRTDPELMSLIERQEAIEEEIYGQVYE